MIETKKSCCDTPYSYSETQQEEERRSCWPDKRTEYREYTCDLFSDTAEHKLRSMIKTQSRPSALYIEESQPFFADRFYWHDPISSTVQRHSQRMSPYEGRWRHWMNSLFFSQVLTKNQNRLVLMMSLENGKWQLVHVQLKSISTWMALWNGLWTKNLWSTGLKTMMCQFFSASLSKSTIQNKNEKPFSLLHFPINNHALLFAQKCFVWNFATLMGWVCQKNSIVDFFGPTKIFSRTVRQKDLNLMKSGADTDGPSQIVNSLSGLKSGTRTSCFPHEPYQGEGLWALVFGSARSTSPLLQAFRICNRDNPLKYPAR